jgi:hypothetical protein
LLKDLCHEYNFFKLVFKQVLVSIMTLPENYAYSAPDALRCPYHRKYLLGINDAIAQTHIARELRNNRNHNNFNSCPAIKNDLFLNEIL